MSIVKSPTQIREEQAQGLIALLNDIKTKVDEDRVNLKNIVVQLNGILERFYDPQDTQLSTAAKLKSYVNILEKSKGAPFTSEPRCNVRDVAEDIITLVDSVVAEVKALGIPTRKTAYDKSVNVNTSVTQNQEQHQDVIVKVLLDAAKDELTGKQRKELLAIAEEIKDPREAQKSILAKLKGFGEDVAANIVANILTNPLIWPNLGSLL